MRSATKQQDQPSSSGPKSPLLRVRGLTTRFETRYGPVHAVNGVDFDAYRGETLAVVGESGSGKSVSMLSIMGLLPSPPAVISGSAVFEGEELIGMSQHRLRGLRGREMSMIFQDPMSSLNPVHTVGAQVAEVLEIHGMAHGQAGRKKAVELLDRVGIPDAKRRVDDYPHQFSGGMRQRVMIAMALAAGPKLLIADEPTTALDVTIQAQIINLVRDLREDFDMAVIWITHDLGVVAELADRIVVMYAGGIVETGTVEEIYGATKHPYTTGLLHSVPSLSGVVPEVLDEIPGSPPDMSATFVGCPFAPRCPHAHDESHTQRPSLEQVGSTHFVACWHWKELSSTTVHIDRLRKGQQRSPVVVEPMLSVRGLKTHFPIQSGLFGRTKGTVRAVDGVDLDVSRGQTLGLVGESGCGKSTLGRTVMRLEHPTEGTMNFSGVDLASLKGSDLREIRRRIQMIFQDPYASMNPGMKVGDVIAEPMRIHRTGSDSEIRDKVTSLLERVGLQARSADRYPYEFSGGQRQRIVIARALSLDPELIVCDEPVSALDVSVQAQIINLLSDLQRDLGVSYIFIAHDLAVVRHLSHNVSVMYLGKIVEKASRDELYSRPLHPYTEALLKAVPEATISRPLSRTSIIQGDLPSPANPPPGCHFNTRCPRAVSGLCDVEEPSLRELEPAHWVACHFAEELQAVLSARGSEDSSSETNSKQANNRDTTRKGDNE